MILELLPLPAPPLLLAPAAPATRLPAAAVLALAKRKMLPAIWFIFSRRECDANAEQLHRNDVTLTSPEGGRLRLSLHFWLSQSALPCRNTRRRLQHRLGLEGLLPLLSLVTDCSL